MPLSPASSRRLRGLSLLTLLATGLATSAGAFAADLLDLSYRPLAGKQQVNLQQRYHGQVLLVVNTASKCGYTPQYEGLEALQKQYAGKGFAVLGFPSNDFKGQEPGDEKQIQDFCTLTYGVKFPMFEKVHVTGAQATPLYQRLTAATGVAPAWNFHKYLVGRDGTVIAQFASKVTPDDPQLKAAIDKALAAPAVH
ncbi:MAG: glutathione peroxidase [Stenotrophomonas indicatrix]|jgi:glutathione peroxidase|uniref:glutathione peroxidase n=1 Tax=Stenotrophomonas TaxID=40323 RepID=UPI001311C3C5|nr:glutathione peroxidase [Stenotrophomonas indicatrix]